jgi:hypothetical protein
MTSAIARRDFLRGAVAAGAGLLLAPRLARAGDAPAGLTWLAGDLHCHTIYSHDVYSPTGPGDSNPQDAYTIGWTPAEQIAIAESRALDFLAITDHNTVAALDDNGYRSDSLTLIPGYEHSLRGSSHAGCLGVDQVFGIDTSSSAGAQQLADTVRAASGIFIINHPFYAGGWDYDLDIKPDSLEVWNIGWPYRHPTDNTPMPVSVSDNYKSLGYWERFLATGPMPANGGSDNHWRSTVAVQGVGQPTTWVLAADRSVASILEAIVAGRTTVSAEPPALNGPRVFLDAAAGADSWTIGDTVPATAGRVTVAVRVVGAPGHTLRVIGDGRTLHRSRVTGVDATHTVTVHASRLHHVRAEVYASEGWWMAALTSPLYFG